MRRALFETYAKAKSFDSLIAANWYSVDKYSVLHTKVLREGKRARCKRERGREEEVAVIDHI